MQEKRLNLDKVDQERSPFWGERRLNGTGSSDPGQNL